MKNRKNVKNKKDGRPSKLKLEPFRTPPPRSGNNRRYSAHDHSTVNIDRLKPVDVVRNLPGMELFSTEKRSPSSLNQNIEYSHSLFEPTYFNDEHFRNNSGNSRNGGDVFERFRQRLLWEKQQCDNEIRQFVKVVKKKKLQSMSIFNNDYISLLDELISVGEFILNSSLETLNKRYDSVLQQLETINRKERNLFKKMIREQRKALKKEEQNVNVDKRAFSNHRTPTSPGSLSSTSSSSSSSSGSLNESPQAYPSPLFLFQVNEKGEIEKSEMFTRKLMFTFSRVSRILNFIKGYNAPRTRSNTFSPGMMKKVIDDMNKKERSRPPKLQKQPQQHSASSSALLHYATQSLDVNNLNKNRKNNLFEFKEEEEEENEKDEKDDNDLLPLTKQHSDDTENEQKEEKKNEGKTSPSAFLPKLNTKSILSKKKREFEDSGGFSSSVLTPYSETPSSPLSPTDDSPYRKTFLAMLKKTTEDYKKNGIHPPLSSSTTSSTSSSSTTTSESNEGKEGKEETTYRKSFVQRTNSLTDEFEKQERMEQQKEKEKQQKEEEEKEEKEKKGKKNDDDESDSEEGNHKINKKGSSNAPSTPFTRFVKSVSKIFTSSPSKKRNRRKSNCSTVSSSSSVSSLDDSSDVSTDENQSKKQRRRSSFLKRKLSFKRRSSNLTRKNKKVIIDRKKKKEPPKPKPKQKVLCRICEEMIDLDNFPEHSGRCRIRKTLTLRGRYYEDRMRRVKRSILKRVELGKKKKMRDLTQQEMVLLGKILEIVMNASRLSYDQSSKEQLLSYLDTLADIEKKKNPVIVVPKPEGGTRVAQTVSIYLKRAGLYIGKKIGIIDRWEEVGRPKKEYGRVTINDFEILGLITRGAFGRVFLSRKKTTGDIFAMKVLEKFEITRKNKRSEVFKEKTLMILAQNPFVVKVFFSFEGKRFWYIVMEFCPGGDLFSVLCQDQFFSPQKTRRVIAELVMALGNLHANGVVHRDLKPDNCLIDRDGHLKLTDFGLSELGLIDVDLYMNNRIAQERLVRTQSIFSQIKRTENDLYKSIDKEDKSKEKSLREEQRKRRRHESLDGPDGFQIPVLSPTHYGTLSSQDFSMMADFSPPTSNTILTSPKISPTNEDRRRSSSDSSTSTSSSTHSRQGSGGSDKKGSDRVFQGTPDYLAPEILLGKKHDHCADYWSLGVMMFEFLIGYPPFSADTPDEIFSNILEGEINWPVNLHLYNIPDEAIDLVKKFLTIDPDQRLGKHGIEEVQKHPFFDGVDWEHLLTEETEFTPQMKNGLDLSAFEQRKEYFQHDPSNDLLMIEEDRQDSFEETLDSEADEGDRTLNLKAEPIFSFNEPDPNEAQMNLGFSYQNIPALLEMNHREFRALEENNGSLERPENDGNGEYSDDDDLEEEEEEEEGEMSEEEAGDERRSADDLLPQNIEEVQ